MTILARPLDNTVKLRVKNAKKHSTQLVWVKRCEDHMRSHMKSFQRLAGAKGVTTAAAFADHMMYVLCSLTLRCGVGNANAARPMNTLDVLVRVEATFASTCRAIVYRWPAAECLLSSTRVDLGNIHCASVQYGCTCIWIFLLLVVLVYIDIINFKQLYSSMSLLPPWSIMDACSCSESVAEYSTTVMPAANAHFAANTHPGGSILFSTFSGQYSCRKLAWRSKAYENDCNAYRLAMSSQEALQKRLSLSCCKEKIKLWSRFPCIRWMSRRCW